MLAKKMEQKFQCQYCGVDFVKSTTLAKHLCIKKQRHLDINTNSSRLGFRSFQRFYVLTTKSKKLKSEQEFIDSPYYIDFVRFGNHLATLKPINIELFIDFVINNSIKLKDWTKDFVYDTYIQDFMKKEPAIGATDRTIIEIIDWCNKNNISFNDFFKQITANEAAYLIKTGKISPWVLYLSSSGGDLMNKFNEDHSKMIADVIDPGFWMKKFKKNTEEVDFIRNLLEEAGL